MIKDFDEVKRQLTELADVVNAFKSEAVQLRLVELILGQEEEATDSDEGQKGRVSHPARKPKARKKASREGESGAAEATPAAARAGKSSSARPGGKATLSKLYESGFFKKGRTINDIVAHADTNMALKLKQSDFSGALARYVRDEKLKRSKNADSQYEYVQS